MRLDLNRLVGVILEEYALPVTGLHGLLHWGRVLENGVRLAELSGGNSEVVTLFAVFHDSRRLNEGFDPDHGRRGALLAKQFRGRHFDLDDRAFELLSYACESHTDELTHDDISVQCCWDADRLDLGRVGMEPDPEFLSTAAAKSKEIRRWAHGRASMEFVPDCIRELWDEFAISKNNLAR